MKKEENKIIAYSEKRRNRYGFDDSFLGTTTKLSSQIKVVMQSIIDGRSMASELHILTGYFEI